jgi:hypothetical protein
MLATVMEGALVIALTGACAALAVFAITELTPWGRRWRGARSARPMERGTGVTCPIHGSEKIEDEITLPSGVRLCRRCYEDAVGGEAER